MAQDDKIIQGIEDHLKELEKNPAVQNYVRFKTALDTIRGIPINGSGVTTGNKIAPSESSKSVKQQIAAIIKEKGRFLHMREIVRFAKEKGIEAEQSVKQAVYALKNDDSIVSFTVEKSLQNTFWGSKSWLDANNNIKPDHMYDPNAVISSKEKIVV